MPFDQRAIYAHFDNSRGKNEQKSGLLFNPTENLTQHQKKKNDH